MLFGSVSGLANRVATRSTGVMFLVLSAVCSHLHAQQNPIPLPYTMTTLAGTSPMTGVAGTQCPNLPAGVTSTDAYGDGCLAANGIFGAAGRGGVQVDAFGNVFLSDDVKAIIHVIDPTTRIMSVLAGGGTVCSSKLDAAGDGCLAATQTAPKSARGIGIDPYGNVLLAGYSDNLIHVVCRAGSPLCTTAQIGYMEAVAGCIATTGSYGSSGIGPDNALALVTGSCGTNTSGEVSGPRGVTADIYGNVYFADTNTSRTRVVLGPLTSSYFTGNNPLYAALAAYYASLTQGYAYTVVNIAGTSTTSPGTATSKGASCSNTVNGGTYSGTALDTYGDGCPLNFSSVAASSGYTSGVAVDAAGNMVFTDPTHGLRVLYVSGAGQAGTLMRNAITANNPGVTPQPGFLYMLWGGGATALGVAPTLGTSTAATDSTITKVTVTPQGGIFIGDSNKVVFYDMNSGYVRQLFSSSSNVTAGNYCSGTSGQKSLSAYSDGCPASKSLFTNSNGLGVAVDGQSNLYLYDASSNTSGMLVRKVLAQGFAPETVGAAQIETIQAHLNEAGPGTLSSSAATLTTTSDITAGTLTCGSQNADYSFDCTVPVTTTPSAAGLRSGALGISLPFTPYSGPATTSTLNVNLAGNATGSVLAVDAASSNGTPVALATNPIFASITPAGVALDGAGNVYAMDAHAGQFVEYIQGMGAAVLPGSLPANPSQIAVDPLGDVFAVGAGTPSITELAVTGPPASAGLPAAFTATSINYTPISGTAAPQAIATDSAGNIFVADKQSTSANTAIYRISSNAPQHQVTVATGFTNPVSLAVDGSGNVYVADKNAPAVYKLTPGIVSGVPGYVQTTVSLSGVVPAAVATDAAGDLYVQDTNTRSVIEVPVSGPSTAILTGLSAPVGLAVDGRGTIYSADSSSTSILQVVRDAVAYNFGTGSAGSPTYAATLTDVGNQSITGSNTVTNTTNFSVAGGASNGCNFSSSILGTQAAGNACTFTANFVGAGSGTVSDVLTYLPAASTIGSLTLTGTLTGTAVATTTSITGPSPANPIYTSGTEATFTVTVSALSGSTAPGGTVAVTVDSTTTNPSLVASGANGVATVTLTGLAAGPHTISAIYSTNGSFTGSNSGSPQGFSIAQATTATTWAPATTSVQFSAPIGASVLNAAATSGSSAVPGVFVYTANGAEVNAGTYLPIGSYSLAVTFYPTDSVDYASSTALGGTLTVTKASTAAAVGVTQYLVASDGSGDYTSVQAAINALPNTGGSIYIKPGTYSGFVTVVKPNVSLYGLGGNPGNVVLTNEQGAFSSPFLAGQGPGNNGSSGDQGSATMVVARGTVGGFTGTPSNFYAENLTIANTYDTDTTTTTTNALVGGVCTPNQPAQTLAALYNTGTLCNSQALAIWITGDQAVLNNVYTTSQQDTIYAGSISASGAYPARQYWFRGKVTGDVDYIFGDAAAVFDHSTIYTTWHGNTAGGTTTIEAQNQADQTGATPSYLSGYVMNSDVFTSQSSGMTNLYLGRPYGHYSTYIMLNSYVDQVNPTGYIEFSGLTNLPTSTYAEYKDIPYTDPATGNPDVNGVTYLGSSGSTGQGVTGTRETISQDPGTPEAANAVKTSLTQAQAQQYYPVAFLGATVPVSPYNSVTNWNPTVAIATGANAFVPSGTSATVPSGSSTTVLIRPQTPGLGAIANGNYAIPTGTYTLSDTYNGSTTTLASGTLDAAGEAFFTTTTLAAGSHQLSWSYSGDSNFAGSSTSGPYVLNVAGSGTSTPVVTVQSGPNAVYGSATSVTVAVAQSSGTTVPTGQVLLSVDGGATQSDALSSAGTYTFPLSGLGAGTHSLTVTYSGDNNFAPKTITSSMVIAKSILQVAANNYTIVLGQALPTYAATITGFVNGDTQSSAVTGSPSLTTNPASPSAVGEYAITASTGTLASANYTFAFTNGVLTIQSVSQSAAVATGDTRTVTEPVFPSVCQTLTASITQVNDDIPSSVDATVTNPDGARIQAALNACASTNQAVRLSVDGAGNNAFLSGPLNMPSGVTLLVDPGVVVFFSRNVQDYDVVQGVHTCGTINSNTATNSCLPLINVKNVSNVGIMGFGKLDGRGGDTLLNAFPSSYAGQSWWGLSAAANGTGNQQNPRFLQISGATSVTLYKITLRNSPLFHMSTTGGQGVNGLTVWDAKIITPTSSRNTDGIDPGQAQNVTITRSWISDGDDNVAVGSSGSGTTILTHDISVTNDHMFAGHGESIGSFTSGGISNVLFDGNLLAGNSSVDSNSTGIRVKSANDRGGVVQNIQYSNSCLQNHKAEMVFDPLYNTNSGTKTPNFKNILVQNMSFLTAGTVSLTGANNNGTINPLVIGFDNVSFASLSGANLSPAPTYASMTYGPGQVSSNFVNAFQPFVGSNGNTLVDNRTATSLAPPACAFTFIAPELTGPSGLPQTITSGQTATAVVILTPAVGGSVYPTGTVTLSDGAGTTSTVALTGTSDTLMIPLPNLSVGTHTFTATYSGDSNYVPSVQGQPYSITAPYLITVTAGNLGTSTTALSGVPSSSSYGNPFVAIAAVGGSNPTGTVSFVVNGAVYAVAALGTTGTAQATLNLPVGSYTISAIYSGDGANAGSTSNSAALSVGAALTVTSLSASTTTTSLGVPVALQTTVSSIAGTPTGTVTFTYTSSTNSTPTTAATATLNNGIASASVDLPIGVDNVTATYNGTGSFGSSSSATPIAITVNPPVIIPLPASPIALPYTISTLAGGSTVSNANTTCAGSTDTFGDGCQATSIVFSSDDLRSVVADPFGNVYFTDANASMIRKISPNGVITNFAGYVSGTACVPSATTGCTPSQVKLNKPRGVAADLKGNLFIAGYSDNKVYQYKVTTGLLYLLAGNGTKPSSPSASNGDGGSAVAAQLNGPRGVWPDPIGNVYIADTSDNKIRVVDTLGNIQTVAGNGTASSTGDGGPATSATVNNPQGVLTDANSNVYIADSSRVRVICITCLSGSPLDQLLGKLGISNPQNGYIYTLAGGGSAAYSAPALANTITMSPQKLAIDGSSNLYISDGGGAIWFVDSRTGYIRPIAGNSKTACSAGTNSIGDGCPATQAIIGNGGNGIGVGTDVLGNIYISDTLNARIRKVSTGLQSPATAVGGATTQTLDVHYIAGDGPAASNAFALTSAEWQLGSPSCAANTDTTADCIIASAFKPAIPGARSTPLTLNSSGGNTASLGLNGPSLGAGATLDPAGQSSFGSGLQVAGLATDNAGNIYVSDAASKNLLLYAASAQSQGSSAPSTTLATLAAPGAVAVDARGFVYVADTSTGRITQIAPGGVTSTLASTFTSPAGLAVDALNNLYVSDSSVPAVYQISPITGAQRTLALGTLVAPSGISIDPLGNLLVADPGAGAVYRFNPQSGVLTTVSTPAAKPSAVLTDAAGNLLVADAAAIDAVPASKNSGAFPVASVSPSALAIDGAGNLYTGLNGAVLKLTRTQANAQFSVGSAPQPFTLMESGNQALTLSSVSQTDTSDYSIAATASTDCTVASGLPSAVVLGGICAVTASYTPMTYAVTTDTATLNGNLSNAALSTPAAVQLVLTGPATAPSSNIVLGAFSPAAPVYGQGVTITATVSGGAITPAGAVTFTVDGSTQSATLAAGTASTIFTGLSAGNHTVSAAYTSSNGYTSASTSNTTLVISQATPTITATGNTCVFNGGGCSGSGSATGALGETLTPVTLSYSGTGSTAYGPSAAAPVFVGTYTVTASYAGNTNYLPATSAPAAITISPAPTVVTNLTVTPSPQQYSDLVNVSATPTSAPGVGGTVRFYINYGSSTQQQLGTTQTVGPNGTAIVSNVSLLETAAGAMAPGNHQVTAIFVPVDLVNYTGNSATTTLPITKEDSNLTYTGLYLLYTASATSYSVTAPLTFTVQDSNAVPTTSSIYDANPGDIRNARFKVLVDGVQTAACSNLQPSLVSSDTRVGTIACNYTFSFSSGQTGYEPTISVVPDTGSYYAASAGDNDFTIAVNLPNETNFINGAGFLVNAASSGTYAGTAGQKTHFGFNVKFNKGETNLQGNANIIISSNGRTYQIKATSITSLGVTDTTEGGYGSFLAKANIQDITDPLNPISIEGNDSLTITFHDNGTPGTNDTIGISVYKGSVLRFASKWNGTATVEQNPGGGDLSAK